MNSVTNMRALLVEDDVLVAMIAEDALTCLGFDVALAGHADAALAQFKTHKPALAVIDVGLPGVRGDVLARQLRALSPDLKMIIASGYDAADLNAQFSDDPGIGVMTKPYTEDDLLRAARSLGFVIAD
jgi:CheY-like chemotaxis protein